MAVLDVAPSRIKYFLRHHNTSCVKKTVCVSEAQAQCYLKWLLQNRIVLNQDELAVYWCMYDPTHWHVGHDNATSRKRLRRAYRIKMDLGMA